MMISGSSLVLFIFLVPMSVLSIEIMMTKECGENIEIPTSRGTSKILTVGLTIFHGTERKLFLSIDETHESYCTKNGKYCIQFGEDRTQMTLTVHSVTLEDRGKYAFYLEPTFMKINPFHIIVTGVCEPKLSSSTDNLTCEVDMESTYNKQLTIVWMDKHRKVYQFKTFPKSVTEEFTKLQDTFKLTDETREVDICCTVSYVKEDKKEEKYVCQNQPSKVKGTDNLITIRCVFGLALGVSLYILLCRRMSSSEKIGERTLSETGLMEDYQAENTEGALSEPLQRPQDQV